MPHRLFRAEWERWRTSAGVRRCSRSPHLTEGSFFVGEDQTIRQVLNGDAVPVTHGATPLKADGTMMGKRLAALIALRDQARHVLHSQHEGWSEAQRQEARRARDCSACRWPTAAFLTPYQAALRAGRYADRRAPSPTRRGLMKLIIAGARTFTDYQRLCQVLAPDRHRIVELSA